MILEQIFHELNKFRQKKFISAPVAEVTLDEFDKLMDKLTGIVESFLEVQENA